MDLCRMSHEQNEIKSIFDKLPRLIGKHSSHVNIISVFYCGKVWITENKSVMVVQRMVGHIIIT